MHNTNTTLHILYASRLVEEKWVDILIDTIETVMNNPEISSSIHWTICSDWLYTDAIARLAAKYPNHVEYLGKITHEQLTLLYWEHDFLYMPSRFLETFWLTALESLACGTPVIGFRKWGLIDFIPRELALDPKDPVSTALTLLRRYSGGEIPVVMDVSAYDRALWLQSLTALFEDSDSIMLVHDYSELIGGAEYYIHSLIYSLWSIGKTVALYSYHGKTSPWKRRYMFAISLIAFWRWIALERALRRSHPDSIWLHSILRYVGPWWLRSIQKYLEQYPQTRIYLSHHDVGMIAPFPQYITDEWQLPRDGSLSAFIPKDLSFFLKLISGVKWLYIQIIKNLLPHTTKHIIFAPFLESPIRDHFPDQEILLFPHSVKRI